MNNIFSSTRELIDDLIICKGMIIGQDYHHIAWEEYYNHKRNNLLGRLEVFKAWKEYIHEINELMGGKKGIGKIGLDEIIKEIEEALK